MSIVVCDCENFYSSDIIFTVITPTFLKAPILLALGLLTSDIILVYPEAKDYKIEHFYPLFSLHQSLVVALPSFLLLLFRVRGASLL